MITCKQYTDIRKKELKERISGFKRPPGLVVVQVEGDSASDSYIRSKKKACEEVGIKLVHELLPHDSSDWDVIGKILRACGNADIDGVILQLPLPEHLNKEFIQSHIAIKKDVDGFRLGSPFDPCTPKGVIDYLKYNNYYFRGKDVLVVGRSDIVGKPLARMLTDLDCTVTLAHSKTEDLYGWLNVPDIVFTCINKIEYWDSYCDLREADVIDVGLGVGDDGKLHGNLKAEVVERRKEFIPDKITISGKGGVGLLTVCALLENTVEAYERRVKYE